MMELATIDTKDLLLTLQQMRIMAEERSRESLRRENTPEALANEHEIRQWVTGDQIAIDHLVLKLSQRVGDPAMWAAWQTLPQHRVATHDLARVMDEFMGLQAVAVRLANDTCARISAESEKLGGNNLTLATDLVIAQRAAEDLVDELANVKASITTLLKLHPRV